MCKKFAIILVMMYITEMDGYVYFWKLGYIKAIIGFAYLKMHGPFLNTKFLHNSFTNENCFQAEN